MRWVRSSLELWRVRTSTAICTTNVWSTSSVGHLSVFIMLLGRHRWVEYAGWNWRFDYMQIAPQWLGWVASLYDEVPSEVRKWIGGVILSKTSSWRRSVLISWIPLRSTTLRTPTRRIWVVWSLLMRRIWLVWLLGGGQGIEMRYRSYKRWGFKDPQKEDMDWLPPQHPLYMETARKMEPDVQEWVPHRA